MVAPHNMHDTALATAIRSKDHLIRWLNSTGRQYVIMDSTDFVRALPDGEAFDRGVEMLQQLLSCYREYRGTLSTGYSAEADDGPTKGIRGTIYKTEMFEPEEWDRVITWAQEKKREAYERRTARKNLRLI